MGHPLSHDRRLLQHRIDDLVSSGRLSAEDAQALTGAPGPGNPVAVVGIAVRVPGADDLDALWTLLRERRCVLEPLPAGRFDLVAGATGRLAEEFGPQRATLLEDPAAIGAWLPDIDQFDHDTFDLDPYEALFFGPAERLFLQNAHEALARAGTPATSLAGSRTGVYVAHTAEPPFEYLRLFEDVDERAFVANIPGGLGYHLSYRYDLRGPVITVNTTCSSSLTAVHLARQGLFAGDCDLAVVSGVSVGIFPFWDQMPEHIVRSVQGHCAPYDSTADGIIFGEGVITYVLQRLDDAVREGRHIHAVLAGSAINSDGASNGMQAPNPAAQRDVVRMALADAGTTAERIGFVEGHGAGTRLGDLVEVDGLSQAFGEDTAATGFCRLGSVKANLGHLGDAAGIAGLTEAILCLQHRRFPGLGALQHANPLIDFPSTPFVVSAQESPWPQPADGQVRRAGVSSLGITGTNVHVVVEEWREDGTSQLEAPPELPVLLAADSRWALWELIDRLVEAVRRHPYPLADIAFTYATRHQGPARLAVLATGPADLLDKLERLQQVRTFEQFPESAPAQGIFLADEPDSTVVSRRHLTDAPDELVAGFLDRFLDGADVTAQVREQLKGGRIRPLPVPPFKTARIWPSAAALDAADTTGLFFDPIWRPLPAAPAPVDAAVGETWLLFGDHDDAVVAALAAALRDQGADVVAVDARDSGDAGSADRYTIDVDRPETLETLWDTLGADRLAAVAGVVVAFDCRPPDATMADLRALADSQRSGVLFEFALARSLLRRLPHQPLRLGVVSSCAEQVHEEPVVPARVTAFGLLKVISQEYPLVSDVAVDHDRSGTAASAAAAIVAELCQPAAGRTPLAAYRDGHRFTKEIHRAGTPAGPALTVREGGVYVLAGGTGYLGMQVARHLSRRGAGTVVLLSRTGRPREEWDQDDSADAAYRLAAAADIESHGTQVVSLRCDLTDPDQVAGAIRAVRRDHGPVAGAFMLAKQLFHTWIDDLDPGDFQAGIHNRVLGTWLLADAVRADRPDFLILFSSISSLMGTKGAAECAAVNQYLDACGPVFEDWGVPTRTLNLTLVLDDKAEFASRTAIPPITFAEFHSVLGQFLDSGRRSALAARLDLDEVNYLRPVLRIPFADEVWQEAEQAARDQRAPAPASAPGSAAPPVADLTDLAGRINDAWAKTLGTQASEADNFFGGGGTSLAAIRLIHLLRRSTPELRVDVADLYGAPTFAGFVTACARLLEVPTAPEPTEPMDLASVLAAVQEGTLDDDQAALLLTEMLAAPGGES